MKNGEVTSQDVRAMLCEVGARAGNVGTQESERLVKRALLAVGKLDAMMLLEGALQAEFNVVCVTTAALVKQTKALEKKQ